MSNHILFVLEGEKPEKPIINSLKQYYLTKNTTIVALFGNNIYNLYQKINKDPYLDLFLLLKSIDNNKTTLSNILKDDVSEIFLFFDYDGHAPKASDAQVEAMLKHFDEETENGKIYISYPMAEALFHLNPTVDFKDVTVNAKNNIKYKNIVHKQGDKSYRDTKKLTSKLWNLMISQHCKKLNYLMNDVFELPTSITIQIDIFGMQKKKHIEPNNEIAVLSAFPIFIADYYGYSALPIAIFPQCDY